MRHGDWRFLERAVAAACLAAAVSCDDGWDVPGAPAIEEAPPPAPASIAEPGHVAAPRLVRCAVPAAAAAAAAEPSVAPCGGADAPPCGGFVDETAAAGLAGPVPSTQAGDVLAWADLDSDGALDLARTASDGLRVWRNLGDGTFEAAAASLGLAEASADSAVVPADVTGDGRIDLVLLGWGLGEIWRATDRGFERVPDALPAEPLDRATTGALADFDGDGDLDLYIGYHRDWATPGFLLRNDGEGRFGLAGEEAGLAGPGSLALQALWLDADDDGDQDLALANDRGPVIGVPTQLFRNDGGVMIDATAGSGLDLWPLDGMGLSSGDFDGDGRLDLWVSNSPGVPLPELNNLLFRNEGGGTFAEVSVSLGAVTDTIGWANAMFDMDADGDLDLLAVGDSAFFYNGGTRLFENLGAEGFRDVTETAGLGGEHGTSGYGASVGDYDGDGYPDIAIAHTTYGPPVTLYRNLGGANRWLRVRLRGAGANRFGVGAKVTAWAGGLRLVRTIDAGSGFGGANPPEVLLGLGAAAVVERIEVRWPSGKTTTVACAAAGRTLEIAE